MQFSWINHDFKRIMLKKFLKRHGVSHRLFNVVKHSGLLQLNGKTVHVSLPMQRGDRATITMPAEKSDPRLKISQGPLTVRYEDANWLVIDKPAGLTSVPGPSNRSDTLLNRIKGYVQIHHEPNLRPHLVTRLDRFTSGVVLVAKHRLASSLANRLILQNRLRKEYLALVSGHLKHRHGQIRMPIGKRPDEIRRHYMKDGKPAWTEYRVVRTYPKFTEVRVRLHTGRTHQIRVHFTETGHPLLGDRLYRGPMHLGIPRQALHAQKLSFPDPFSKHTLSFQSPLPNDMKRVLNSAEALL